MAGFARRSSNEFTEQGMEQEVLGTVTRGVHSGGKEHKLGLDPGLEEREPENKNRVQVDGQESGGLQ
ncbi:hypothetical protein CRENBAI_013238 [Crenichthys baileyi]|uniref:Uncharacterized protein n=1 Tax=Crenichthys baileyi TaxID=28760 RepID=A0AAV9RFK7_9TELE